MVAIQNKRRKKNPILAKYIYTTSPSDHDENSKDGSTSKYDVKSNVKTENKVISNNGLNTDTTTRKEEQRARELWHKMSGAVFVLFVEYYGGQPPGVVDSISNSNGLTHPKFNISKQAHVSSGAITEGE